MSEQIGTWTVEGSDVIIRDGGTTPKTISVHCKSEQDREDEIRIRKLIAAAPELLEALIRCEHAMGDTQSQSCSEYQDAIDQAKAAIERATK